MVKPVPEFPRKSKEFVAVNVDPPTGVNVIPLNAAQVAVFVVPLPVVMVAGVPVTAVPMLIMLFPEPPIQVKAFVIVVIVLKLNLTYDGAVMLKVANVEFPINVSAEPLLGDAPTVIIL